MYTYDELLDDVAYIARLGAETGAVGASVYGRIIPYIKVEGETRDAVIITAGIHAREHVSSLYAVKQLYRALAGKPPCDLYFVPMVNPDGNVLVEKGADVFGFDGAQLRELNDGKNDFSLWKANARGVDLNVNFDAKWGEGAQNVQTAGSENYIGEKPFSEPESAALAEFTRIVKPSLTLSYHAKGREIYYDFYQSGEAHERDRAIAEYAAQLTGYRVTEGTRGSAGGYKDWCVEALGIPALTLELVSDVYSHPLPDESIASDFAAAPDLPGRLYTFMKQKGYV